jgi:hypothetical protein
VIFSILKGRKGEGRFEDKQICPTNQVMNKKKSSMILKNNV